MFNPAQIRSFEARYTDAKEQKAISVQKAFLKAFPLKSLERLALDDYVIGKGSKTSFCYHVEVETAPWASIKGATSGKFGIYFGRTKASSEKTYRWASTFGKPNDAKASVYRRVNRALLDLVKLGQAKNLDFEAIDQNPLTQMFKAKILSLYFPKRFLDVCSRKHLAHFGKLFNYEAGLPSSKYQHLLLTAKNANKTTRTWSNPKFMQFLYYAYPVEPNLPDIDASAIEGNKLLVTHLKQERSAKLVKAKKAVVLNATGKLCCEACGFDFKKVYGNNGDGFCEVHHKKPLAELDKPKKIGMDDLAIVCSNCHRIIHRTRPTMLSIEALKDLIKKRKNVKSRV